MHKDTLTYSCYGSRTVYNNQTKFKVWECEFHSKLVKKKTSENACFVKSAIFPPSLFPALECSPQSNEQVITARSPSKMYCKQHCAYSILNRRNIVFHKRFSFFSIFFPSAVIKSTTFLCLILIESFSHFVFGFITKIVTFVHKVINFSSQHFRSYIIDEFNGVPSIEYLKVFS